MDPTKDENDVGPPPAGPAGADASSPESEDASSRVVEDESIVPDDEQPLELPAWVAPAIGIALVAIASMAVWTGFRPRARTDVKYVFTEHPVASAPLAESEDSGGAPGDPGPGASRVVQSQAGGEVPRAEPLPEGEPPRATIVGDAEGVVPTASIEVRRGIAFDCDRPDAIVYVNDLPIGEAGQFGSKDQPYEFSQEGSFTVRVVARDGIESRLAVVATVGADTDVMMIRVRLTRP